MHNEDNEESYNHPIALMRNILGTQEVIRKGEECKERHGAQPRSAS